MQGCILTRRLYFVIQKKDEYAERRSDIGPLAQREIREACEFFDMCEADCRNMLDAHYYVWVNRIDPEEEANQQQEQWDDGYDDDDEYPEDHRARGKGGRDEYGRGYDAYQNNGGYQDDGEYQSHDEYHGYNDQHRGNGEDRGDDEDHHTKGFKGDEREIYDEHEKMGRGKNSHPKKLWAPRHPFEGRNDNSKGRR